MFLWRIHQRLSFLLADSPYQHVEDITVLLNMLHEYLKLCPTR